MSRHGLAGQIRLYSGGLTEDDGAAAAQAMLADQPPTAIIAFNDRCATGVLQTVRAAGLDVPGDISITGYDDSHLARVSFINLTTIVQDIDRLARLAVNRAVQRAPGADRTGPHEQVATHT